MHGSLAMSDDLLPQSSKVLQNQLRCKINLVAKLPCFKIDLVAKSTSFQNEPHCKINLVAKPTSFQN